MSRVIEIGSEFSVGEGGGPDLRPGLRGSDFVDTQSGRAALDLVVRDALLEGAAPRVALPLHCCGSMVEPALRNGCEVSFYETPWDIDPRAGLVLVMDHFGYDRGAALRAAQAARASGAAVVYDATHKLNGNPAVQALADYSFCSYRKWLFCFGASASKSSGEFAARPTRPPDPAYERPKRRAALEKEGYLRGEGGDKASFLAGYASAEEALEADYAGRAGEAVRADVCAIGSARAGNARVLADALSGVPLAGLPFGAPREGDLPMFVPLRVGEGLRDALRGFLRDRGVYCPVHWPAGPLHPAGAGRHWLYKDCVSLVCDQRYAVADMEREASLVLEFLGGARS